MTQSLTACCADSCSQSCADSCSVLLHLAAPNRQISMTETWENLNLQNFAGCPLTPLGAGTIGAHVSGFGAKNVSLFLQEVFLEWPLEWNLWHCHLVWCSWAHHLEFVIWPLIGRNTVMSTNSEWLFTIYTEKLVGWQYSNKWDTLNPKWKFSWGCTLSISTFFSQKIGSIST